MKPDGNYLPAQRRSSKFIEILTTIATNAGYALKLSIAKVISGIAIVVGGSITMIALWTALVEVDVAKRRLQLLLWGSSGSAQLVGMSMKALRFKHAVSLGCWNLDEC